MCAWQIGLRVETIARYLSMHRPLDEEVRVPQLREAWVVDQKYTKVELQE